MLVLNTNQERVVQCLLCGVTQITGLTIVWILEMNSDLPKVQNGE